MFTQRKVWGKQSIRLLHHVQWSSSEVHSSSAQFTRKIRLQKLSFHKVGTYLLSLRPFATGQVRYTLDCWQNWRKLRCLFLGDVRFWNTVTVPNSTRSQTTSRAHGCGAHQTGLRLVDGCQSPSQLTKHERDCCVGCIADRQIRTRGIVAHTHT